MELGDWEVAISGGNSQILRNISDQVPFCSKGYFRIWGGVNEYLDCYDDYFNFNSIFFLDDDCDEDVVWQYAHTLLALFNGYLSMHIPNYSNFRVSEIRRKGTPLSFQEKKYVMSLMGQPQNTYSFYQACSVTEDSLFLTIRQATVQTDIYILLLLFEQDLNFSNLYRILESVEEFAKQHEIKKYAHQIEKKFEINPDTRRAFTNTANNFSISNFDSRHGFKQAAKENNSPTMSLNEAYEFISNTGKNYLNLRLHQLHSQHQLI